MRFPFSLTRSTAWHLFKNKLLRNKYFPFVLMLEPLHACNLRCTSCGRIREYNDTVNKRLALEECLDSMKECNAPIISICGGEPLIYPEIIELVDETLKRGKHIYLCTNGQVMEEKLDGFVRLASTNHRVRGRLYWNVHLDGPAKTHDAVVEKSGAFDKAFCGIAAAKEAGFRVYTNTTLYKMTDVDELAEMCELLTAACVDGMMMAPGYGYEAVVRPPLTMPGGHAARQEGGGKIDEQFFLTREETKQKFREIREKLGKYRLTATPIFMDFLCGDRELPCAAWANPTRNVKGWKGPCYLVTDKHFTTYKELIEETDWSAIGFGHDKRCEHCMMHCGYEPAAVLFGNRLRDLLRLGWWQLG